MHSLPSSAVRARTHVSGRTEEVAAAEAETAEAAANEKTVAEAGKVTVKE